VYRSVKHRANPKFWQFYAALPENIQQLADENYKLLKRDPRHPSLHIKKVDKYWSARVGIHYRAVAIEDGQDVVWFWIGHHSEYDQLVRGR
jgi:mRNA-degrading endonuclease RelE of RelBE toxin-antitoxin system